MLYFSFRESFRHKHKCPYYFTLIGWLTYWPAAAKFVKVLVIIELLNCYFTLMDWLTYWSDAARFVKPLVTIEISCLSPPLVPLMILSTVTSSNNVVISVTNLN